MESVYFFYRVYVLLAFIVLWMLLTATFWLRRNPQKYNKHKPIFLLENIFTYKNFYRKSRLSTKHLEKNHTNTISHAQWNPLNNYSRRRTTCGGGGMKYVDQASERVHLEVYEGRKLAPITLQKY